MLSSRRGQGSASDRPHGRGGEGWGPISRLLVASNRLPLTVTKQRSGLRFQSSAGGLATGLTASHQAEHALWVGWAGIAEDRLSTEERAEVTERLAAEGCLPVHLSQAMVDDFYLGFANETLWPLAHYFTQFAIYDARQWQAYQTANGLFCDTLVGAAVPGDTIWVHDYHLMLLPALLRQRLPEAPIGFFLHIPFPTFEVFRQLPWRREILQGLLGADLIGFHTEDYAHHFLDAAARLLGTAPLRGQLGVVRHDGRAVRVGAFPMGIDYDAFARAVENEEVEDTVVRLGAQLAGRRMVLSVDRLDYSKGIPRRLEAFNRFLERHPELRGQVTLVAVAVPSRSEVRQYQILKREVQERVSEINGRFGTLGWVPVWYLHRSLPFRTLVALYHLADVCLVTPLRDGMNLVAKEYVACQTEGRGVLVLSEMAGAAEELTDAVIVNPFHVEQMAEALHAALVMDPVERRRRNRAMQAVLRRGTVQRWAARFTAELEEAVAGRGADGSRRRQLPSG